MRNRTTKHLIAWAMAFILVCGTTVQANASDAVGQDPSRVGSPENKAASEKIDFSALSQGFAVGFDAVIVRPLYVASLVVGSIMLLPAIGMAALDGEDSRNEAIELFVTIPYEDAIERELGDF